MALDLYEHNANAYMAAYEMMDKYGKAAIVHPTGTGKSYIAFKLIEAHPNEMIIWLSQRVHLQDPAGELTAPRPGFPTSKCTLLYVCQADVQYAGAT